MSDITVAGGFRLASVFSKSFGIFSRRFLTFVLLTIIALIPYYITAFAVPLLLDMRTTPAAGAVNVEAFLVGTAVIFLVFLITYPLASGAVMYGVVQELRGRRFSIGDSIATALRRVLVMIGIGICTSIAIFFGGLLLFVPGMILACMFYLSTPACIAEGTGVFASMSRSRFLTKGHRWKVFGAVALITIGAQILLAVIQLATYGIGPTALQIGQLVVATLTGAVHGIVAGVFYYEARVAKEGIDIDKIASVFD